MIAILKILLLDHIMYITFKAADHNALKTQETTT